MVAIRKKNLGLNHLYMKLSAKHIAIIGWLATILTILSFTFSDMSLLRIINMSACVTWIVYGFYRKDNPMMVTNFIIALVHLVKIFI